MSEVVELRLADVFADVPDPRDPRGVRHSMNSVLLLVFLGMLSRLREMKVLERWAEEHWGILREPIGSDRKAPPDATTISRLLSRCSLGEFSRAFRHWLRKVAMNDDPLTAAVDGKTACQGHDAEGNPVHLLTVFVHRLKVVLGQWSVKGEKTNEPGVLKNHLDELLREFPLLNLLTGDAIFAQRPLVEAIRDKGCDYLFQVKGNQPDIMDALISCLGEAQTRLPAAETAEKRGAA